MHAAHRQQEYDNSEADGDGLATLIKAELAFVVLVWGAIAAIGAWYYFCFSGRGSAPGKRRAAQAPLLQAWSQPGAWQRQGTQPQGGQRSGGWSSGSALVPRGSNAFLGGSADGWSAWSRSESPASGPAGPHHAATASHWGSSPPRAREHMRAWEPQQPAPAVYGRAPPPYGEAPQGRWPAAQRALPFSGVGVEGHQHLAIPRPHRGGGEVDTGGPTWRGTATGATA